MDLSGIDGVRLIPAARAQRYIAKLESNLAEVDSGDVFLVDDGVTGTSDELFDDIQELIMKNLDIGDSKLVRILNKLYDAGNSLRIWWASDADNDYLDCVKCATMDELVEVLVTQMPIYRVSVSANKKDNYCTDSASRAIS